MAASARTCPLQEPLGLQLRVQESGKALGAVGLVAPQKVAVQVAATGRALCSGRGGVRESGRVAACGIGGGQAQGRRGAEEQSQALRCRRLLLRALRRAFKHVGWRERLSFELWQARLDPWALYPWA